MEITPRAEILTKNELLNLIQKQKQPCISIYMPTHWVGADTQQNQIRFKNLLREAQEKTLAMGVRPGSEAETLFAPAFELHRNSLFWKKQSDGLAVFLAPGVFRYYRLPLDFKESITVGERFYVKPVLQLFSSSGRFYVLALSQAEVRVLQGFRDHIMEVDTEPLGMPKNLDQALRYDTPERETRAQPVAAGIGGGGMFHGHGGWTDFPKDNIMRYLLQVDRSLQKLLREEREPLVFAGVEYIFAMYREVTLYPYLMEEFIPGNPETASSQELGKRAWEISQRHHEKSLKEAVEKYRQSVGTGLASDNLLEIVPAARHGRVGVLFVAKGEEKWGSFNPGTGELHLHDRPQRGDEDLLDLAALQTFLNRGDIFVVEKDRMPEGKPVAALFRY